MAEQITDKDHLVEPLHLTDKEIRAIEPKSQRMEIYDDHKIENGRLKLKGVKGLALRVTPAGAKSFVYRYWYDGKTKRYTIGSYPTWGISDARDKARELAKIVDAGNDPANQKKKNKEAITLGEYIEVFRNDYVERKLKSSTQKSYNSRLNKICDDRISKMPLKDIDRSTLREFLNAEVKEHPTNANRLHAILSKVFNEAIEDDYITKNPIKGMNKLADEESRDVRYTDDDIKAIWGAISEEWEPMQSLLKMLFITGQRLGETSKMKWSDIHNRIWYLPQTDTKNKKPHTVPLPNMALNLLKKMKSINDDSEYVFASQRDKTGHLTHFMNVIERIRRTTMLIDFRLHDLRHIVATKMIELDVEFIIVGKVLNHQGLSASNAITSRYINSEMTDRKTEALNIWAGHLTELTTNLRLQEHG